MRTASQFTHHYALLAGLLVLGTGLFVIFRNNPVYQQSVLWGLMAGYVLWGITHHLVRRDLTGTIVLEYLMLSLLAGIVVQSLIIQR